MATGAATTTAATTDAPAAKPDPHVREGKPSPGERFRDLGWLFALVFRAVPRPASLWLTAGVVQGILTPLQLWAGGQLIGSIAAGLDGRDALSPWFWLTTIAVAQIGSRFLDAASSYLEVTVIERGIPAVQARVYEQATAIDLGDYEHQGFYDATSRIMEQIEGRAIQILRDAQGLFGAIPRLVGALVLIFGIDWRIAVIALLPLVPDMALYWRTGQQVWTMLSDQTRERRLATYYAERMTDRRAAKEIRLFGLQRHLLAQWSHSYLATRDELRRKRLRLSLRSSALHPTMFSLTLVGLVWLFFGTDLKLSTEQITVLMASFLTIPNWVYDVSLRALSLGEFSGVAADTRAFVERPAPFASDAAVSGEGDSGDRPLPRGRGETGAAGQRRSCWDPSSLRSLGMTGEGLGTTGEGLGTTGQGLGITDVAEHNDRPAGMTREGPGLPDNGRSPVPLTGSALRDGGDAAAFARRGGTLEASDLRFTYPGSARTIVDGIDLAIPAGQRVAIVGENGAGKTTLLKLLLGLYAVDDGSVTLDGVPVRDIPLAERQRRLAAVFQQFTRYPLTMAENITLGTEERHSRHPERSRGISRSRSAERQDASSAGLDRVLAMAGMDDYVRERPDVLSTVLAPDLGGVDLSGGQWQRLAIARAGYRDADVLALDEPTAALDPMAEVDIFRRFARLAEGRTTLLVSHRLGMCRLADRIVVIEHGRVIEDGTHDSLRAAGGRYAEMWSMQARWYV